MNNEKKKVVVIGLDCAAPRTLFKDFLQECPNIQKLLNNGVYGKLKSSDPPITIPAWTVMATSKKAGNLGIYGFRHRKEKSYSDFRVVNSENVKEKRLWEILGENKLKSIILGLPPTYPVHPINGYLVSGFITPDTLSNFTYPPELKGEISENVGDYILDVKFRTNAKENLLISLYKMTKIHFATIRYLMKTKQWDFTQFVIIGLDRLHHAFWKFYDNQHHKYEEGNVFESAIKNYYKYLDREIGEILKLLDDNTIIFVVSDHGAKAMKGCICVNMALEKLGLLKFKKKHEPGTKFSEAEVDWSNSHAWGWGGYYARIFLNVKDREKQGIINPSEYETWRDKITKKLKSIRDREGNPMDTKVYKPEDLFDVVNGNYPDLMVYFDDLNWRSAGTIGYDTMYLDENDTGPDDAVHDHHGIFIINDPQKQIGKELEQKNILDITPTILNIFGIEVPKDMQGKIIDF